MTSAEVVQAIEESIINEKEFQVFESLQSDRQVQEQDRGNIDTLDIFVGESTLLKLLSNKYKQVIVSTLNIPLENKALKMKMIELLFNIINERGYELFIDNMEKDFYHDMLERGAREAGDSANAVKVMSKMRFGE